MRDVYLHGYLGERFGDHYALDVRDPAEAIRALTTQIKGLDTAIHEGEWSVIRGPLDGGVSDDVDGLSLSLGSRDEIHIMPAISGAGDGLTQIIAGAALIGASFFVPGAGALGYGVITSGAVGGLGVSMALGGVSQMLSTTPESNYDDRESPDKRPSFLFDGPVNTSTQGLPVPIVYGKMQTGSVVVSAGMTAEEIDVDE